MAILNESEFFTELEEYYNKDIKQAYKNRVKKLLFDVNVNDLESIFDNVTFLHEASTTLPTISKIAKAISTTKQSGAGQTVQARLSNTDNYSIDKVIDRMKEIKKKDTLHYIDIDFMCDWDLMFYCYSFLKDKEWTDDKIFPYLENLKARIITGENVLKDSLRRDEGEAKRSGEVSFDDIQKQVMEGI